MATFTLTRRGPITTLPIPGESKSQYVPHAVQLPNGDLWYVVKGDESRSIHAYKSVDGGVTFVHQGVVIAPSGGSNWDAHACLDPVLTYDAASDTLHYLWKGNAIHAGYGGWAIGHGTAPGSNPLALTRDPMNPVLTPAIVQAFFPAAGTLGDLYAADAILDPWGVLTVWCGYRDSANRYHIFRTRGGWSDFTPRGEGQIHPLAPWTFVQAPTVYRRSDGRYVMIFTEGHDSGNPGALHQTSAWCEPDGNWAWQRNVATFLHAGPAGSWDTKVTYAASLLKGGPKYDTPILVNGKQLLFYSGQPTSPAIAHAGIAELTPYELVSIG